MGLEYYPNFVSKEEGDMLFDHYHNLFKKGLFEPEGNPPRFVYSEAVIAGLNHIYTAISHMKVIPSTLQ